MRVTRQAKRARLSGFEWFTPTLKPFIGWTFPSGRVTSIPSYGGLLSCFFKLSNSNWWCWEILDQKKAPILYHFVPLEGFNGVRLTIGGGLVAFGWIFELVPTWNLDWSFVFDFYPSLTGNWFENWWGFHLGFGNWAKLRLKLGWNSKFNWKLVSKLVKILFSFWSQFEIQLKIGWDIG